MLGPEAHDTKSATGHLIERAADRLRRSARPDKQASSPAPPVVGALPPVQHERPAQPVAAATLSPPATKAILPPSATAVLTIKAMLAAGLVSVGGRSRVMEEWRIVAASLLRTQPNDPRPLSGTLMVTSSQPAEGKSFCSLNLAATVARGGQRAVLLIDLDQKPGAMSALLDLGDRTGLLDLVRQPTLDVSRPCVATEIPGLDFLPLGRPVDGEEHEPGLTQSVITTLERVARRYPDRLLILDMPPCLATSDAATLAPHVGQIAMVVEAERTQRTELDAALGLLDPCETINLVLNKSRATARGHFGGSYGGYYGYYGGRK